MSYFVLLLILSTVIGKSLGLKRRTVRIVGGKDATDVPFIVALVETGAPAIYNQFCAGSIVGERWILTAAHCTEDKDTSDFYIIAGVLDISETDNGQFRNIKRIYDHPHYNKLTVKNDISLLELETPLNLKESVAVIDIANEGDPLEDGQNYNIAGWGALADSFFSPHPNHLQLLEGVPHYNFGECKSKLKVWRRRQICAGAILGEDACDGDSGGPLWMKVNSTPLLYGITSWGKGCGTGSPGVYTKVSFYRKWMERKMKYSLSNPCSCVGESDSCACKE